MSSLTAFSKCRTVEDISCSTHDNYAHALKSFPSVSGTVYFKRKVNCKIVTSPSIQMVSPENIHVSSIVQTEKVIFRNISAGAYMHKEEEEKEKVKKREVMNLKRSREEHKKERVSREERLEIML